MNTVALAAKLSKHCFGFCFVLSVLVSYAFADGAASFVGSSQFLDGIKTAADSPVGGRRTGGFSKGWMMQTIEECDPAYINLYLENAVAARSQLIFFEPCSQSLVTEAATIKKLRDAGAQVVLVREAPDAQKHSEVDPSGNDDFKSVVTAYSKKNDESNIHSLQDFGIGYTIGMALKSYSLDTKDLSKLDEALLRGNNEVVASKFDADGVLSVDGWAAKVNCNPCPKSGACPQKVIEAAKQCCGASGACPQ